MKKVIMAFSLSAALSTGLTPWSGEAVAQAQEAEKPYVPVIVKEIDSSYFQIVIAGAEAAGRDLGVKVEAMGADSETNVDGQIALLNKAVSDMADAVVIAPTNYTRLGIPIDNAAKNLPVVVIDSNVESLNYSAYLSTDNTAAGALAADALAKALGVSPVDEGVVPEGDKPEKAPAGVEIAIVNYVEDSGSLIERSKGFKDQLFAKYPSLTVVDEVFGSSSSDSVRIEVEKLLLDHPKIAGLYTTNIFTTQVAGELLKQKDLADKISVIGWDSSDQIIGLLEDGTLQGVIVQDPYKMGYDGVKSALDIVQGKGVLQRQDTGAELITKANMNGETENRLLHPPVN